LLALAIVPLLQASASAALRITGRRTALAIGNSEYQAPLDDKVVSSGDLVRTADVRNLVIRPSLAATGEKLAVSLVPATQDSKAKPLAITVAASVSKSKELAAERFDIPGLTERVLPNEIDVPASAVARYPDVARFKYQNDRVLYAKGDFKGTAEQFKSAFDMGTLAPATCLGGAGRRFSEGFARIPGLVQRN